MCMKTENKIINIKRIAIIGSVARRKELIEWSYSHKDTLANHELIATHSFAKVLEGTIHKPVYQLAGERSELDFMRA
jgi:methylglyoxal synthase